MRWTITNISKIKWVLYISIITNYENIKFRKVETKIIIFSSKPDYESFFLLEKAEQHSLSPLISFLQQFSYYRVKQNPKYLLW